eukprot:7901976-Pyramimonas_sp.AAC.1
MPELIYDTKNSDECTDYNDPWANMNGASDAREFYAARRSDQCRGTRCPSGWTACCCSSNDADADGHDDDRWHYEAYYHEQSSTCTS